MQPARARGGRRSGSPVRLRRCRARSSRDSQRSPRRASRGTEQDDVDLRVASTSLHRRGRLAGRRSPGGEPDRTLRWPPVAQDDVGVRSRADRSIIRWSTRVLAALRFGEGGFREAPRRLAWTVPPSGVRRRVPTPVDAQSAPRCRLFGGDRRRNRLRSGAAHRPAGRFGGEHGRRTRPRAGSGRRARGSTCNGRRAKAAAMRYGC